MQPAEVFDLAGLLRHVAEGFAFGEIAKEAGIMRNTVEYATDKLRQLVDHQRLYLPWDEDLIAEEMHGLLARSRAELGVDVERDLKLGIGGIREVEFFAQSLQLVWGGREPSLRVQGTLPALGRLQSRGLVSDGEVSATNSTGASAGFTLRYDGGTVISTGNVRRARSSAACTSTAAASMSRPWSNSSVTDVKPSVFVELMTLSPGIVWNCFSSCSATEVAIVSGLAPGSCAATLMTGVL